MSDIKERILNLAHQGSTYKIIEALAELIERLMSIDDDTTPMWLPNEIEDAIKKLEAME